MIDDVWPRLFALNRHLATGGTLDELDVEDTVFEVYLEHVEEEMFLAAVTRMADRRGLQVFRVDVEDGKPSMIISVHNTQDEAQSQIRRLHERRIEDGEFELG